MLRCHHRFSSSTLWGPTGFTKFNSRLPAHPESVAAVLKVLSQNDELMVKDIARLGRLTQSQARVALEELIASGTVVVRKLQRPRKTLYRIRTGAQG
jgi:predicted ArsR family transcriptional regulator